MSKPADVLNQIKTQLANYSGLSYVNDESIFLGVRESITIFPCIIIEPISISEQDNAYPNERLTMRVAVMGYINCTDKDKQIVGNSNDKGILDVENDVKLALDSDRTLGGNAIHLDIAETTYQFVEYPIRSFAINIDVLFQQTKGTRT